MALFEKIYARVISWAKHRHATRYLAGLSFAESSLVPLPPDLMLVPMALAQIDKAWYFAGITTLASALGGIIGYCLGCFCFDMIEPMLQQSAYWSSYQMVSQWVNTKGMVLIMIAGFLPIPFKIFTLSAGALHVAFVPFMIACLLGRAARFYTVSGLLVWKGARMQDFIIKYIERIGWVLTSVIAIALAGLGLYWSAGS